MEGEHMPMFDTATQLNTAIDTLCNIGLDQADEKVRDTNVLQIGCVDEETLFGDWNPPGGMIFVYLDRPHLMEKFFLLRQGKSGVFGVHDHCAYMYRRGYTSVEAQTRVIKDFINEVNRLNAAYGCDFEVIVEHCGSAKAFMDEFAA